MKRKIVIASVALLTASLAVAGISGPKARADDPNGGRLFVSRSVYEGTASTVNIGQALPGGGTAVANGSYPGVWANEGPDPSFGVTSPVFIDRYSVSPALDLDPGRTLSIPANKLVTSFSSKSELALGPSTDGKKITFMGYVSPVNALDVSNSNTPNHVDPTNPVALVNQRAVAEIDTDGEGDSVKVTPVDAYSGNNGRAAVLDSRDGEYLLAGNAGNGGSPPPLSIVDNTGVQLVAAGGGPETTDVGAQKGSCPTPPAPPASTGCQFGYSVVDYGYSADKSGKDDNFRGMTIFNNTLYVTKGSGSNGIDTVFQVGSHGALPASATASTTPITILPGFSTTLAKASTGVRNPFGLWFADAKTLYVADEGDGKAADASTSSIAGLEKWVLESDGLWHNVYTLQNGLNLGVPYSISGLPSSLNPATDGLRSLTGRINGDGTVTLFSVTSTVSASVDQGADPNKLVAVTDVIANTTPPGSATSFKTLQTARFGEVLRGVAFISGHANQCPGKGSAGFQSGLGDCNKDD